MTAAERFLQEKLNPPKSAQPVIEAKAELENESLPVPAFLRNPVFSNYKIFWSIGAVLVVILMDVIIMMSTDSFEAINDLGSRYHSNCMAYIVSLLTPISFWIPILLIAHWAWNQAIFKVLMWVSSVWMIVLHLIKIGVVFSSRGIEGGEVLLGIIMFLLGGLGIAAVVWCLVRLERQKTKQSFQSDGNAETESTEKND